MTVWAGIHLITLSAAAVRAACDINWVVCNRSAILDESLSFSGTTMASPGSSFNFSKLPWLLRDWRLTTVPSAWITKMRFSSASRVAPPASFR